MVCSVVLIVTTRQANNVLEEYSIRAKDSVNKMTPN